MRSRTAVCLTSALFATSAHASGDPAVLYWMAAGALIQVVLLAFVLIARKFQPTRWPMAAAYVLHLVVLWNWVLNSSQSLSLLGTALVIFPLVAVGVLMWMLAAFRSAREP